ncbi:alpha/beta hydrolase [Weissella coleopterorum]|uniref:alpha/beta hydrolase n=1 Tax=Weissella coleopterorum TaxID=2714949 RepID=UPI001FEB03CC|nr:alpha/beta hydrolase [Weissella coleopterorum]
MKNKFIEQDYNFKPATTKMIEHQWHDIQYMAGQRHQLDIYLPNHGTGPFPVIIDIYGGGLWRGQKSSIKMKPALQFLAAGFAVVSLDYSLLWQAAFPTQIYEVKAALRWLHAQGSRYQLNLANAILMGESSGAQLAVLAGLTANTPYFKQARFGDFEDESETVQGIIAMYGPYRVDQFTSQFKATGIQPKYAETGTAESFEGQLLGHRAPKTL